MGFFDKLFGRRREPEYRQQDWGRRDYNAPRGSLSDEQAIERYRYMLRTAPPETIEQAHEEAFSKLTPEQRRLALQQLSQTVPPGERAYEDDPRSLARMATRAEMRQPGTMERTFGGMGGVGMGGMGMGMGMGIGATILGSLAAGFVGSAIANEFFDNDQGFNEGSGEGYAEGGENYDDGGAGMESYGSQGADSGDFGGGDFGGGDFGGGDFGGGGEF